VAGGGGGCARGRGAGGAGGGGAGAGAYLAQLLDLVLVAADVVVRDVRLLLDRHHRHRRVDLRRQRDLDLVLVAVDADAHPLLDVGGRDAVAERDDELGDLLHVDHVLGVVGVRRDDLGAARHLQRLLLLHHLLVGDEVPLRGRREAGVELLHAHELLDLLVQVLDVLLRRLDRLVVRPHAVRLEERDVALVERADRLLVLVLLGLVVGAAGRRLDRHICAARAFATASGAGQRCRSAKRADLE
jgi:hypothetical protein